MFRKFASSKLGLLRTQFKFNNAQRTIGCLGLALGTAGIASAQSPLTDSPSDIRPPTVWDRLRGYLPSSAPTEPSNMYAAPIIPTDKLACHPLPQSTMYNNSPSVTRPIVLVACGSFNPPTIMHLRMLDLARHALMSQGTDVLGSYLSPVSDAYWKPGLLNGGHRRAMCQYASKSSPHIMTDGWEVEQPQYTRTLFVLQSVEERLRAVLPATNGVAEHNVQMPRAMLVCGADVLHTMADPSLWKQDLLEDLLANHGVVCISRTGSRERELLAQAPHTTVLGRLKNNLLIVEESIPNEISSSAVRREIKRGAPINYLVPEDVVTYIEHHTLYV